jgi:small subunit ribosomal protein S20
VANIRSAIKRVEIAERNRLRNKSHKSAVQTLMKKCFTAVDKHTVTPCADTEAEVKKCMSAAYQKIDKAVQKGVLHRNNGANKKSRLAKALRVANSGSDSSTMPFKPPQIGKIHESPLTRPHSSVQQSQNFIKSEEIELLIEEAVKAGIAEGDLKELREHLADIKDGRLIEEAPVVVYQEVEDNRKIRKDIGKEIIISTALGLDDDFKGVTLKEIKKPRSSSSGT